MTAVLDQVVLRYLAVVVGTALWDAGAILQKRAVDRLPPGRLRVVSLLRSGPWMAGLAVTAAGWAAYVFAIDGIPVSAARTVSGGSYVVLALFSVLFLRTPLRLVEWLAVLLVTAGIFMLGAQERGASSATVLVAPAQAAIGIASIGVCAFALLFLARPTGTTSRPLLKPLVAFAALSGLLSSIGDLCVKIALSLLRGPVSSAMAAFPLVLSGAGLIGSYLAGFYMLSRAYQAGTVVGGVVLSDFFARLGAIFLGAVVLSEPLAGPGAWGPLRLAGFLAVLGGSLILGRFGDSGRSRQTAGPGQA